MNQRYGYNSTLRQGKGFRKPPYAELLAKAIAKRKRDEEKPATERKRLGAGRRMKEWRRVWTWLKPRLEAAGRTRCEFDFIPHACWGRLDPCHATKRSEMKDDDIYRVALGCQNAHQILDERLNHEQMHVAVMYAINRHGGTITPATEAARRKAA